MTDGEGTASYVYNTYRQLQSETRTFTGLANKVLTLSYAYNQADQVKQAIYAGSVSTGLIAPAEKAAGKDPVVTAPSGHAPNVVATQRSSAARSPTQRGRGCLA